MKRINLINIIFIIIVLIGAGFLNNGILVKKAKAANCGGATPCVCGDTVTSSYTMTSDLNCGAGDGLIVGANGITINGNSHTITVATGQIGINNTSGFDNITIDNFSNISGGSYGINFANSTGNTIQDNSFTGNTYNLFCTSCSNTTITRNDLSGTTSVRSIGLSIASSTLITASYNTFDLNSSGASFSTSSSSQLINNTITRNSVYAINISSPTTITDNIIRSSTIGINVGGTASTITGNGFYKCSKDIVETGPGIHTFSDNKFYYAGTTQMIAFTEQARTKNINDTINFDLDMKDPRGDNCATCSYDITSTPAETVSITQAGKDITGSFVVTKQGTYSLVVEITDTDNNITKRNYQFLVGSTQNATKRYYLRSTAPEKGQPGGTDSGSMTSASPSVEELWTCGAWIQNSPNELPLYPVSYITDIDTHSWYFLSENGWVAVDRYEIYDASRDISLAVPSVGDYTYTNQMFSDINLSMDTPWFWYWFSLKLVGSRGGNPGWLSSPDNPSYADFAMSYTDALIIKSLSNDNLAVLSAIKSGNKYQLGVDNPLIDISQSSNVTLENFNRVFPGAVNQIDSSLNNILYLTLSSGETENMENVELQVTPSADNVSVLIDTWRTSGDYYKKWTETATGDITTSHIAGDLAPNTFYIIRLDGVDWRAYASNSSGEISFIYNEGFSTHTFEIVPMVLPESGMHF